MTRPEPETCGLTWIILRCANASTLRLAASLNAAGIEAWSPVETVNRRVPRRSGHKAETLAVLPSFVFATAERLGELLHLSNSFSSPHAGFWVFRAFGEIRTVADRELDALRVAESKGRPKDHRLSFEPGAAVRCADGGLQGLPGQVQYSKGNFTFVLFGSLEVRVPTVALLPDAVSTAVRKAA